MRRSGRRCMAGMWVGRRVTRELPCGRAAGAVSSRRRPVPGTWPDTANDTGSGSWCSPSSKVVSPTRAFANPFPRSVHRAPVSTASMSMSRPRAGGAGWGSQAQAAAMGGGTLSAAALTDERKRRLLSSAAAEAAVPDLEERGAALLFPTRYHTRHALVRVERGCAELARGDVLASEPSARQAGARRSSNGRGAAANRGAAGAPRSQALAG